MLFLDALSVVHAHMAEKGKASPLPHRYHNQEGVNIRPHDFGGLSGIASLDPSRPELTATYLPLIRALKRFGYEERSSLWGAPYDWRLAADGLQQHGVSDDLQSLIEMAYAALGYSKVVVIAHSMVCPLWCLC
jgi:hypothetical protein